MSEFTEFIKIRGASLHNLKQVNADIPVESITAICGPSGSGKSSLALGTLHHESQRRYLETLNPYLAQLAGSANPVPVDSIEGLGPSIAFKSGAFMANPRATVGSISECDNLLRQIWVHGAQLFCPHCNTAIHALNSQQMLLRILAYPLQSRLHILAPISLKKRSLGEIAQDLLSQGFMRLFADEKEYLCAELDAKTAQIIPREVQVVVDRIIIKENMRSRLADSIETALRMGENALWVKNDDEMSYMSVHPQCPTHGIVIHNYHANLFSPHSPMGRCKKCAGTGTIQAKNAKKHKICPECQGFRLKKVLRSSKWGNFSWEELQSQAAEDLQTYLRTIFQNLAPVLHISWQQLQDRLQAMESLGLGHLSLHRPGQNISDGELLRLRLVPLAGGHLSKLIFVLDEPASGLHPKDCASLWKLLQAIQRRQNTIVLIEHHPKLLAQADWMVEIGPEAGEKGGEVLHQGPAAQILANPNSPTGRWLQAPEEVKPLTTTFKGKFLEFSTDFRYLQSLKVKIPLGAMTLVSGISGSGKSTLIFEVLLSLFQEAQDDSDQALGKLLNSGNISEVIAVDSSYLRGNKRSMVATVTDILTPLRRLLASTPAAKVKGYTATRFSPNTKGGRCEACAGLGYLEDPTQFGDVPCHQCLGKRFRDEVLEIRFKTLNIAEIFDLSIAQAAKIFRDIPPVKSKLDPLLQVGLGYLRLGHATKNCSAGEMQRLKLAAELQRNPEKPCLYIFDEPARGLHRNDSRHLLDLMQKLITQQHTVVVIEHSQAFMNAANMIIEMGPQAGAHGGDIINIINRLRQPT
ncbi:MAG: hypothetical protein GX801_07905 [Fibrobacter sp.]|nr:hypothetical protein [Fibrobacter sp.]